jgi:glutaminyl-tRNA synthetase
LSDSPQIPRPSEGRNFIQQIVASDLESGRVTGPVITRFPPEPNGYLHIGHAKSISLNFSLATEFGGRCHLRFDDTNPETEDMEFVRSIQDDLRWLGFDPGEHRYFASDYFEQLYELALRLIDSGKAYVDSLSEAEIRDFRGTVTEAGVESPHRNRTPEENRDLFVRMRKGEFPDGSHVLRARIDMASPNMLLRDPVLYRIKHAEHYRRGSDFPIYPLYDFAHPLSDAIEGITHSVCTLEFEVHRPLYDWLVDALFDPPRPHQYEFARLFLDYTVMSKRKLLQLVSDGHVTGWDDPRMPSIAGFRRRGYTPESIRAFCEMIGVAKADNRVDPGMLEYAIRDDLNTRARRIMCVLRPLKVILTNFPEDHIEWIDAPYWPHDIPKEGNRAVPITREILIERDDFQEIPSKKFHRLSPGKEVRLRYGYIIRCDEIGRDADGNITELRCSYDPETRHGQATEKGRVKGTIHWVSATEGHRVEVRLYDRLFAVPDPSDVKEGESFADHLNAKSLETLPDAVIEPSVMSAGAGEHFQFERQGFFFVDPEDSADGSPIFNRTVTLRDTWAKVSGKTSPEAPSEQKKPAPPAQPESGTTHVKDPYASLSEEDIMRARNTEMEFGLSPDDSAILVADRAWFDFFEEAAGSAAPVQVANWIIHEMRPVMTGDDLAGGNVSPAALAELVRLLLDGVISSRIAKDIFSEMLSSGATPSEIMDAGGLAQISDTSTLESLVDDIIGQFPDRVAAYRDGKTGLLGFFTGQVMRASDSLANPEMVQSILRERLSSSAEK